MCRFSHGYSLRVQLQTFRLRVSTLSCSSDAFQWYIFTSPFFFIIAFFKSFFFSIYIFLSPFYEKEHIERHVNFVRAFVRCIFFPFFTFNRIFLCQMVLVIILFFLGLYLFLYSGCFFNGDGGVHWV